MADGQTALDRIFPLEDMDIRAADRGGGDAHQRIIGANFGDPFIFKDNPAVFNKDRRFHHTRHNGSCIV